MLNILVATMLILFNGVWLKNEEIKVMKQLTNEEKRVMIQKGTEAPFTGKYYNFNEVGIYHCKNCGKPLYRSNDKFSSGCGWPSFDDEIHGAVKRSLDADGARIEITCANCGAHLGHLFQGEGFTPKNIRHCVNSVSLDFEPLSDSKVMSDALERGEEIAYFAGGCFWGVEHLMQQAKGVISVDSGYMGGKKENPSYEEVKSHTTGHAEVVRVIFDPSVINYETIAKLFFEIHDPTEEGHQGPDYGPQYRSEVFYANEAQKATALKLIDILKDKGYDVKTHVTPSSKFWKAEEYHQDYYKRKGTEPYCHFRVKRF